MSRRSARSPARVHFVKVIRELFVARCQGQPLPHAGWRWQIGRRLGREQAEHRWRKQARIDRKAHDERLRGARVQADAAAQRATQVEVWHVVQPLAHGRRLQQRGDVVDVLHRAEHFGQGPPFIEALVQAQGDARTARLATLGARQFGTHLVEANHLFHATGEHALVGRGQQIYLVDLTEVGP